MTKGQASALEWLRERRDKAGRRLISEEEYAAPDFRVSGAGFPGFQRMCFELVRWFTVREAFFFFQEACAVFPSSFD